MFVMVIAISFLPVLFQWMGLAYLGLILVTDLLIVFFTVRLLKSGSPEAGRRAMRGIYLGALFGVLAAILGQVLQ
jgi:geranylgeranylglycerol-phosphate geranylgeranyltransferase